MLSSSPHPTLSSRSSSNPPFVQRVTAEKIAKADAEIKRLEALADNDTYANGASAEAIEVPNGNGEDPAEPAPTPAVTKDVDVSTTVSSDAVDEKLEEVKEEAAA